MILDKHIKSKDYNGKNIDVSIYKCPKCKAKGTMKYHACYKRFINSFLTDSFSNSRLTILRVKCTSCDSTHAILPGDLIPYKQFNYSSFMIVLKKYFLNRESGYELSKKYNVSYQTIYSFIKTFLAFKDDVFVTLRIMEIANNLFKMRPSKLIELIRKNFSFDDFVSKFNSINNWPFLMTKFRIAVVRKVAVGFR